MIQINKGQSNTVALTLTEKVSLDNPFFLFEFKNDQTKESTFFIAADISTEKSRYNKFIITEKSNPDNLNGEVSLSTGFHKYIIREQDNNTNIDPDQSGEIVEIGKVKVIGTPTTNAAYDAPETNIVYNG
jgi:hypothetical protein